MHAPNMTTALPPPLTLPRGWHDTCGRFSLGRNDDERSKSEKAYVVMSAFKDAKRTIRLAVLPWGSPGGERENTSRGGNLITLPGHPLWDINTPEEVGGVCLWCFQCFHAPVSFLAYD